MLHCRSSLFDGDPDSSCHLETDPDPNFYFDADPDLDPDPSFQMKAQKLKKRLANNPYILACHLQMDATRIRIPPFTLKRTHADSDPQYFGSNTSREIRREAGGSRSAFL
jgi:hypothetical protein